MPVNRLFNMITLFPLVLQLGGLTFAAAIDPYIGKKHKRIFAVIVLTIFLLLAQNYADYLLSNGEQSFYNARIAVGVFGYCLRPVVIVLFTYLVSENEKNNYLWILIGLNALVYFSAFFTDIAFTIDEGNVFRRGALGYTCHIVSGVCLLVLVYFTVRKYRRVRGFELLIPIANSVVVIISVLLDSFLWDSSICVTFLSVSMVLCSLFYYIWLHLQFVREHENALQAESRLQIMMSQIQPHFLYNTLSMIQALCLSDPKKAFDITEKFGAYLRRNIDSLGQADLIPIGKELEHTKIYAEIEMTRFSNLSVTYDIKESDFMVLALTVQPLVENAIRHGVRIRSEGKVIVTTGKRENQFVIVISDNGRGFDVN
ncbi:MAG: histidine kinase, partial [Clostridia bacterium]|nr:histidine kinase [Clostridia bacterium]